MVHRSSMVGTGQLPKFEEDAFMVAGTDYFLVPTAEVPVTNMHRDEILDGATLPLKYCAYTACFPAMKAAVPGFVGNCEGTDLTSGNFDVVVADGMSGNIALKATEGAAKFLLQELKGVFMSSLGTKIAALLIKKQMREIKAKLSGDAKGGAILLGLRGVVLIGHGATSVEAVKNGALAAAEAVRAGLVENVANSMDGIIL